MVMFARPCSHRNDRTRENMQLKMLSICSLVVLSGCCFDLTSVKQQPVTLRTSDMSMPAWVLQQNINVPLESWSTTHLNKDTTWQHVGHIEKGDVYKTKDQIVTVEGSNIHEAYIVISGGSLVGFYLPVEKTFSPVKATIKLPMKTLF